ncbi:hypothetical protein RF11_15458 [Thelohanellus kitauei]|uniref:Uncharacterized protein n=1 Tax=Thelohanellus kitauei TaxID=669202 RepID=A0A0C2MBE0_THEKT|nr:hypothetical protein RF11_15458 [Thelohanellus kitauei]
MKTYVIRTSLLCTAISIMRTVIWLTAVMILVYFGHRLVHLVATTTSNEVSFILLQFGNKVLTGTNICRAKSKKNEGTWPPMQKGPYSVAVKDIDVGIITEQRRLV